MMHGQQDMFPYIPQGDKLPRGFRRYTDAKPYLPSWLIHRQPVDNQNTTLSVTRPTTRFDKVRSAFTNMSTTVTAKLDLITTAAEAKINAFKNKISNSKLGEIAMKMKFAGERGLYDAKGMGGILAGKASKVFNIVTRFKDLGAMKAIGRIISAASILKEPIVFTVKAITSAAHAAINALKTAIKGLAVAAGAIVIGGATKAVTGAADLQTNIVSIEHFIRYANYKEFSEDKGPLKTDEEIKAASAAYVEMLRKYAAVTPFSDADVIGAGRKAINIMSGNLSDAEELVKIAGDMAA